MHNFCGKIIHYFFLNSVSFWITYFSEVHLGFCNALYVRPVAHLLALQADEARKYGARVYCVGIKDFDEQQVRELYSTLCVLKKKKKKSYFATPGSVLEGKHVF